MPEGTFPDEIVPFFETSSKSGDGVDILFSFIFNQLLERIEKEPHVETVNPGIEGVDKDPKPQVSCCKN